MGFNYIQESAPTSMTGRSWNYNPFSNGRPSKELQAQDPWAYGNWSNPSNVEFLEGFDDGSYMLKVKSADKAGTSYHIVPTDNGGYKVAGAVDTVNWDTNSDIRKRNRLIGGLAAAAIAAPYLAPETFSGLLGGEAATGAASGGTAIGGATAGHFATPGLLSSEAMFLGATPEVLAAAGINPALTSSAMAGAAGIGAGGPTMGAALTGGLGAGGAALTDAVLAGASGIGTGSLLNYGGLAADAASKLPSGLLKDALPLAKELLPLAAGAIGAKQADKGGGGPQQFAPFTPANVKFGQRAYEPNRFNQQALSGLLSRAYGIDPDETRERMGGGGLLNYMYRG